MLTVAGGGSVISPSLAGHLLQAYSRASTGEPDQLRPTLTATEQEVLRLLTQGLTDRQIAERLYVSPRTVQNHLARVRQKTSLSRRSELARWAVMHAVYRAGAPDAVCESEGQRDGVLAVEPLLAPSDGAGRPLGISGGHARQVPALDKPARRPAVWRRVGRCRPCLGDRRGPGRSGPHRRVGTSASALARGVVTVPDDRGPRRPPGDDDGLT